MFERRIKVVLLILFVMTGVLLLRATHLQLINGRYWSERAESAMYGTRYIETVRGKIVDFKGRVVAEDVAATDVCVDYRAVIRPADARWVESRAIDRLRSRMGDAYRKAPLAERRRLRDDEVEQVNADIDAMWARLADVARHDDETPEQAVARVEEIRQSIIARVEMRRRYLWYRNYEKAVESQQAQAAEDTSIWRRWLLEAAGGSGTPDLDKFIMTVAEQEQTHVVLRNVAPKLAAELARDSELYPGLSVEPGTTRYYPYKEAAAHILGRLSRVDAGDVTNDPNAGPGGDDTKQYFPNDLIGRTGIELMCEPALRGHRGKIERRVGEDDDAVRSSTSATRGQDVRLSIDIELQRDVQQLFKDVKLDRFPFEKGPLELYGAAIVLDVPTGQVRAIVSNPSFDPNELEANFAKWSADLVNRPTVNRATLMAVEPGSTVKPIVGLSAITDGILGVHEGIECTGYLKLGNTVYRSYGRCWTAKRYQRDNADIVAHHKIPPGASAHHGKYGNPDGFLVFSDGLERSCNVFFEEVADRMGPQRLSQWYQRWGLGRRTGIGIGEYAGLVPKPYRGKTNALSTAFAGIGQGAVNATPIQMANVAATIARGGIWRRPRLVAPDATHPFEPKADVEDERDLHLSPEGVAEAKLGMVNVVNAPGGTGTILVHNAPNLRHLRIAAKTGTAQAQRFSIKVPDPDAPEPEPGKPRATKREFFEPMHGDIKTGNNGMPWYRGAGRDQNEFAHAWYMGFAPAEDPKIAFCVFVEYGGSGSTAAGPIAQGLLEACIKHGYLPRGPENGVALGDDENELLR
jgi:penicillin-binding protein 2